MDGVAYDVIPADNAALDANTWQEYADELTAEIAAMVAAGDDRLASVIVYVDDTLIRQTYNDAGDLVDVPAIVVEDLAGGEFTELGFNIPDDISGEFNVFGRFNTDPSGIVDLLITVNVELEKAGRGGDGGELVIGGMNKDGDNEWGDGSDTTPAGVEQFDVVVNGGADLPNSISSLRSTNNALRVVNIDSAAGVTVDDASLSADR